MARLGGPGHTASGYGPGNLLRILSFIEQADPAYDTALSVTL